MIVTISDDFDLEKIAESGQCFRWRRMENGYVIPYGNKIIEIIPVKEQADSYTVNCQPGEWNHYWAEYFDLRTDYRAIRARLPWAQEGKKEGLRKAFESWKPICDAHGIGYAQLVMAWALQQYEKMNLIVGMRKPERVLNTASCTDITLTGEELAQVENVVKGIQERTLDK